MKGFFADCRHAARLYARTPGPSLIAIFVLAVGAAFVGTFLSLYVDLALRPYPGFEESASISTIGQTQQSYLIYFPFQFVKRLDNEMTSIEAVAAWTRASTLVGPERDEAVAGLVSEKFFSGLRPQLALGRGFRAEENVSDAEPVVVLSYSYWMQRFGGDPNVLGTSIEIAQDPNTRYQGQNLFTPATPEYDSAQFRIVGVMDKSLRGFPTTDGGFFEPAIWVPLVRAWPLFRGVPASLPRTAVATYVRRAPGVSSKAVANELRTRYEAAGAIPNRNSGSELDAIDGIVSSMATKRNAMRQLRMFLAGSVLLALVAAANVSLFLLARAPGRRRELSVRLAVGAPMRRLARQLATEAGLLVVVSAVLGLLASGWLSLFLRGLPFMRGANWTHVTLLDWRVLGLSTAFLLMLTVLVSLAPIVGFRRLTVWASGHQVVARASLAQRLAGTAQIAVAATLGAAAIAFAWYLSTLMFGDPGYTVKDRYLVEFGRFASGDSGTVDPQQRALVQHARRHAVIEAIPGVTAVAFGDPVPGYVASSYPVQLPDPADSSRTIDVYVGSIEPEFINLLGLKLLYGRGPEIYEPGVVLINQTLARKLWGRDDVVGEHVPGSNGWGRNGAEVIGVLQDLSFLHPSADPVPYAFVPQGSRLAVVETRLTAAGLQQAFERIISDGKVDAVISQIQPLNALRSKLIAPDRARGLLTIVTAVLVIVLAAFGYYGTQRYLVAAGRREYAIRASLGAGPSALGWLVIRRGFLMNLPGLAFGLLFAFIVVAWLRSDYLSLEISPTVAAIAIGLGLISLLLAASLGPAREARREQPAVLLRED